MTRNEAIIHAAKYGLSYEVKYCIDALGMSPEEALYEWDVVPEDGKLSFPRIRMPFRKVLIPALEEDTLRPVTRRGDPVNTDLSYSNSLFTGQMMDLGIISRPSGIPDPQIWDRNGHILASGEDHPDDLFAEPFDEETYERFKSLLSKPE